MNKKNNHYVPKCLLKRWNTNNGFYDGVFVFDIPSKNIDFSYGKGKSAFSFASIDNLYILNKDNKRFTNLEDWFSGLEQSISKFIDKVTQREKDIFRDQSQLHKLLMGLLAFDFRSKYFFQEGIKFIENDFKIKSQFAGKSSLQIMLENVVNATTEKANQIFPVELIICKSNLPLLICDRPLLHEILEGYSFFPLSPDLLLLFKKSKEQSFITYNTINDNMANSFNNLIVDVARDWIVSTNKEVLEEKTKNKSFKFSDKVVFEEIKTLLCGYEY